MIFGLKLRKLSPIFASATPCGILEALVVITNIQIFASFSLVTVLFNVSFILGKRIANSRGP